MSAHGTRLRIAVATLALLVAACGDAGGSTTTVGELTTTSGSAVATTEATIGATTTTEATAPAGQCDEPAESLTMGVAYEGVIDATADPYPANARYFCVEVPAGLTSLTFTLTDLEADLDLYVGTGSIESVQGLDAGSWEWAGQEFETTPERIEIANPVGGVYYIEVFDYDQEGSTYRLLVVAD